MVARLLSGPFLSVGVCNIVADLSVVFVYGRGAIGGNRVWFVGGSGAESITFDNELSSGIGEVGSSVRNVALRDAVFCRGVEDLQNWDMHRSTGTPAQVQAVLVNPSRSWLIILNCWGFWSEFIYFIR